MEAIEFVPLATVPQDQILSLMNNPLVRKHMPLLAQGFSAQDCRAFLQAKQQLWDDHGYGPWAVRVRGRFAGWGGLQREQGDADFALVLHPEFWGWGKKIFLKIRDEAFGRLQLESFTVLLPPSRTNARVVRRLGFVDDGQLTVGEQLFLRFRLQNPTAGTRTLV